MTQPQPTPSSAPQPPPQPANIPMRAVFIAFGALALVIVAIFALALAGLKPTSERFAGTILEPPLPAADFSLRDAAGNVFRMADAGDKVVVLTFLYTRCNDVCPFIGAKLRAAADLLAADRSARVEFVVVSTDPEGDTPQQVTAYSNELGMEGRWRYLVGTKADLEPVWKEYYIGTPVVSGQSAAVSDVDLRLGGLLRGLDDKGIADANRLRADFGGTYDVSHSTPVWVITGGNEIRLKHGQDLDPADLASDVRKLAGK